jgi:hypothetical protein
VHRAGSRGHLVVLAVTRFGGEHGLVSGVQERVDPVVGVGGGDYADAAAYSEFVDGDARGGLEAFVPAADVGGVGQDGRDDEFVAAESAVEVSGRAGATERVGGRAQDGIAGCVAVGVVDDFKPVEVDVGDGELTAGLLEPVEGVAESSVDAGAAGRHHRRPHRTAQPPLLRKGPAHRGSPGRPLPPPAEHAVTRHRPLQTGQRHLRPRRRRPDTGRGRPPAQSDRPRRRPRRLRRRGIHGAPALSRP